MATSGWEGFVHMMQHRYNKKKKEYTKTNILRHAAIISIKDGTAWAVTADWPGLSEYDQEQETENGLEIVHVNEFQIMNQVAGGVRRPGIRMGGEKYTFVRHDPMYKSTYLIKATGGAICAKTKTCILIGTWSKDATMSNNIAQNQGDAAIQVEDMADYLREKGV